MATYTYAHRAEGAGHGQTSPLGREGGVSLHFLLPHFAVCPFISWMAWSPQIPKQRQTHKRFRWRYCLKGCHIQANSNSRYQILNINSCVHILLPVPAGPVFLEVTMRMIPSSPHGLPQEFLITQYPSLVLGSTPQPATEITWLVCWVLSPAKMPL